jgi:hypothetical protein
MAIIDPADVEPELTASRTDVTPKALSTGVTVMRACGQALTYAVAASAATAWKAVEPVTEIVPAAQTGDVRTAAVAVLDAGDPCPGPAADDEPPGVLAEEWLVAR